MRIAAAVSDASAGLDLRSAILAEAVIESALSAVLRLGAGHVAPPSRYNECGTLMATIPASLNEIKFYWTKKKNRSMGNFSF